MRTLISNLSLTVLPNGHIEIDCIYRTGKNCGLYLPNR